MITRLDLDLFKCFRLLRLPLAPLTLLSGTNASGKSTVLQALVLLHQTMHEHEWSSRLKLNGSELQLGNVTDVIDKVYGRREFQIGLTDTGIIKSGFPVRWKFDSGEGKQDMSIAMTSVQIGSAEFKSPLSLHYLMPSPRPWDNQQLSLEEQTASAYISSRLVRLSYLTAERVGPRESYQLEDPSTINFVGPRGENAVGLLYWRRDQQVLPSITLGTAPPTLISQVEARMRMFFPNVSLKVAQVPNTNIVTMGLRTSDETDFHRPVNVGFGLTQVFPIIVAALAAVEGDLLLIENPEVHLHPAGQALMGQFLSEIAAGGIQVLVETHSDHVLNGIRRAVKAKILPSESLLIHFFRARKEGSEQVLSPRIDADGNVDHWPSGFFDQFEKDLNHFAGWGE